jgi:aspartyl-tRNA(Asn)/glutamyl-tRNA(Gln) amidotransferase subunit B
LQWLFSKESCFKPPLFKNGDLGWPVKSRELMAEYVASVGMEVHAELATKSKMFCRCEVAFGGEPNTRTCPICLGLPGTLPVPNSAAIELVLKTALALNCTIAMKSIFHRKNYFYPDLPKGYQVSQYGDTNPLGYDGKLELPSGKFVRIRRVHLEEDTGKLLHLPSGGSGVDYNRAGTPLMEIVTEFPPDIQSPDDAKEYLSQLRQILLFLGVCDGKMEEGSLRCEPNISVRIIGSEVFGTKTELKNLNSFRSVQLGVAFEVRRQIAVLEGGGKVLQETRGWNEQKESSFAMRLKEAENDYRYFPDPDLVPMVFEEAYIEKLRAELPELPLKKFERYREQFGLSEYDAGLLTSDRAWSNYFEAAVSLGGHAKLVCNWMTSDFAKLLNDSGQTIEDSKVKPKDLVELVGLVVSQTVNGKTAKKLLADSFESGKSPKELVAASGATQISDRGAVEDAVKAVLTENEEVVQKYRSGQMSVLGFLVGQVMKKTGGRANPQLVKEVLTDLASKES